MTLSRKNKPLRLFNLACVIALTVLCFTPSLAAQEPHSCNDANLKGDYGLLGQGIRMLPGGVMETFVTVAMVSYDGNGNFTSNGTSHGSVSGVRTTSASGTYHVNPDCTGSETTIIPVPGVPPLEDNFVIVAHGQEVRTLVTSPLTTIASANLRKK